jgi:thiol-disulfide isomerase/thioredoxin
LPTSVLLVLTVLALPSAPPRTTRSAPSCEPTPEVAGALEALKLSETARALSPKQVRERRQALEAIAAAHPQDVHAQDELAHVLSRPEYRAEALPRYREAALNGTAAQRFLYAGMILQEKGTEAHEQLRKALELDPTFSPAHLPLATLYSRHSGLSNKPKALEHVEQYLRLCPESTSGYGMLKSLASPARVKGAAQTLRKRLELPTAGVPTVRAYPTLWELELAATKVAQHEGVRALIAKDLTRIQTLGKDLRVLQTLQDGHKMLGRKEDAEKVQAELLQLFPRSYAALAVAYPRCKSPLPYPGKGVTDEKYTAYWQSVREVNTTCTKSLPDFAFPWTNLVRAAHRLESVPQEEAKRVAERVLQTEDTVAGGLSSGELLEVAELYLKRSLELAKVPALVDKALGRADQEKAMMTSDWSPDRAKYSDEHALSIRFEAHRLMTMHAHQTKANDRAVQELSAMEKLLATTEPKADAKPDEHEEFQERQRTLFLWSGRVQRAQGKKLDALAQYQRALFVPTEDELSFDTRKEVDALKAESLQLWKELGGTAEGHARWVTAPASSAPKKDALSAWEKRGKDLPAFTIDDLGGKQWKLSDLKGKVTFVNVWATWCGPCKEELPYVKKLHEKLKGRKDVQLISFNADSQMGLVDPFMKEHGIAFPVIPALSYVEGLVPSLSIPRNWIVGKDGRLLYEHVGFAASETWVEKTLATLQEVAKGG